MAARLVRQSRYTVYITGGSCAPNPPMYVPQTRAGDAARLTHDYPVPACMYDHRLKPPHVHAHPGCTHHLPRYLSSRHGQSLKETEQETYKEKLLQSGCYHSPEEGGGAPHTSYFSL